MFYVSVKINIQDDGGVERREKVFPSILDVDVPPDLFL